MKTRSYIRDFEMILCSLAYKHKLRYAITFNKQILPFEFCFFIDGTSQAMLDFANTVGERLPLSIYFVFKTLENTTTTLKPLTKAKKQSRIPDAYQTKIILEHFKNISTDNATIKNFNKIFKKFCITPLDSADLYHTLDSLVQNLKENKEVIFHTQRGAYCLSLQKSDVVMFFDINALQTFMRIDSVQMGIMASFEKPSMKLCAKDVFKEALIMDNKVEAECVIAFDLMLALFGVVARQYDVEYVFIRKTKKETSLHYELTYPIPKKQLLVCGKNGLFIEDRKTPKDLFYIIKHHYKAPKTLDNKRLYSSQELIIYLSSNHKTAIWTYDNQAFREMLDISFHSVYQTLCALQDHYKDGDKLLKNYKERFGDVLARFKDQDENLSSHSLVAFFAHIAKVLLYCDKSATTKQGIEAVLNNAKLFMRDKGPRIDYKLFKDSDGRLKLDCPRILRSCMSFALGGVDEATLCYGVIDSMAEFLGNLARDIQQNYSINQVFLCGDMLTHKIFLDKILHYLPKDMAVELPQNGFIDTKL